jgi:hypothetical protein
MTNPEINREKMLARLAAPMPDQALREMTACAATDSLAVALEATRMAIDIALNARTVLGHEATAAQLERRWLAVNMLLGDTFDTLETHARATINAVHSMLALE